MTLLERYKDAPRTNKRTLSRERSGVQEVPLYEPCILLPNKKKPGIANEVDEFFAANWAAKRTPRLFLVEQEKQLADDLKTAYESEQIPVFHTKLSNFTKEYAGRISYMHADYCATVNQEAHEVLENLMGKLATTGAVLRFTHSRRNNYRTYHIKESQWLIDFLVATDTISRKAGDNLYYRQCLPFQTDPTLRVGIQLITNHVMNLKTLKDCAFIRDGVRHYEITDCIVDRYKDTGANMQTMRFVLKPVEYTLSAIASSLYTVYNALS